ncbi:hypothetical protein J7E98_12030, partial [Streptomyces sp. ISL-86]|nr:hypothetical protein [Streptomyces sp. ISL-86]
MQSTPTPQLAPSRRDLLAGLGLAAAAPLLLGVTAGSVSRNRPADQPVPVGRTVLLRGAALVLTMDPALASIHRL